jgi:hypothetical protein
MEGTVDEWSRRSTPIGFCRNMAAKAISVRASCSTQIVPAQLHLAGLATAQAWYCKGVAAADPNDSTAQAALRAFAADVAQDERPAILATSDRH